MISTELISQVKENVNKRLASILAQYKGRPFVIMMDNEIMTYGNIVSTENRKSKIIRASYRDDNKPGEFHIGYYDATGGKPEFIDKPEVLDVIIKSLLLTEIFGIDFVGDIDVTNFEINVDNGFNVIYINSAVYSFVKLITLQDKGAIRLRKTDRVISNEDIYNLKEKFKQHSVDMYIQVCTSLVLRRLKSVNALKFYKLHNVFIPVAINGSFVFNPFIEIPSMKDRFLGSDLYKLSEKSIRIFGKVSIRYITQREICETMHLGKFVGMPWKMFTSMLAGNFLLTYPNLATPVYVIRNPEDVANGYEPLITKAVYDDYSDSVKEMYNERDSLYVLALQYAASVGTRDVQALYNIIKDNYI